MDLQPYSHNHFSKILRTFYAKGKIPFVLINTLLLHIPLLALTHGQNDGWRDTYTRCMWAGGTFFPVVLLCQLFGFWWEIGFGFTYLCTQSTIHLCCCVSFWFWREIVFGVTYVLSVQYSCAVVSLFWLGWEIILKMRTPFYNFFLLGYSILIRQPMCVFHET